jgi:hypothetical protein
MKDLNGKELAIGQTVITASKDNDGANVPVLKKGVIVDLNEGTMETYTLYGETHEYRKGAYVKVKYEKSGRISTIDGYMDITDKRFCIVDE